MLAALSMQGLTCKPNSVRAAQRASLAVEIVEIVEIVEEDVDDAVSLDRAIKNVDTFFR